MNSTKFNSPRQVVALTFWFVSKVAMSTGILLVPAAPLFALFCGFHVVGAWISTVCVPLLLCLSIFYVVIVDPALAAAYDCNGTSDNTECGNPIANTVGLVGGGFIAGAAGPMLRTLVASGPYLQPLHSPLFVFDLWVVSMSAGVLVLNLIVCMPDMLAYFLLPKNLEPSKSGRYSR